METEMLRDCAAQLRELAALAEEFGAPRGALGVTGSWLAELAALLPPPPSKPPSRHALLVALFAARVVARRLAQFCDDHLAPALKSSPPPSNFEEPATVAESFDTAVEKYVQETCQMALRSLSQKPVVGSQIQLSHFSGGRSLAQLFPASTDPRKEEVLWCGAACQQGALLHSQHDQLPSDTRELREVRASGQLRVELQPWRCEEQAHERSSLTHLNCATHEVRSDTSLKHSDMRLRHSIGSSHLDLVRLVAMASAERPVKVGRVGFQAVEMPRRAKDSGHPVSRKDRRLVDKLWKFFDELAKRKYCTGPPLVLKLRRDSLVDDIFKALMAPSRIPLNYYRTIELHFAQENQQEGMGEFLPLVASALFSTHGLRLFERGMAGGRLYPSPASSALPEWFQLCGVLLGLSFLHQRPLMVALPKCFFKCLFDRPMSLPDLEELDPVLLRRLEWVRSHRLGSQQHPFTFTVRDRMGALSYSAELLEGGADMEVTDANKRDYVEACLRWKLAERCLLQLQEIRKGFISVLDPKLLDRFSEEELQAMIEQPVDYSDSEDEDPKSHSL